MRVSDCYVVVMYRDTSLFCGMRIQNVVDVVKPVLSIIAFVLVLVLVLKLSVHRSYGIVLSM